MTAGKISSPELIATKLEFQAEKTKLWTAGHDTNFPFYGFLTVRHLYGYAYKEPLHVKYSFTLKEVPYAVKAPCECGAKVNYKGKCTRCYYREYMRKRRMQRGSWL